MLWSFSTSIAFPFLSLYILALGGTPSEIGLINSLGILAGMILYPVGGHLGDKMGRARLVGYATYAYAISNLLYVFANSWQMVAIAQFFHQILQFYMPAMNALEADSLPPGVRGRGFATMMAIPASVRTIAPYVGGWIITAYGGGDIGIVQAVRLCWFLTFLVGVLVATMRLKYLRETLPPGDLEDRITLKRMPKILKDSYAGILESLKWVNKSLWGVITLEVVSSLFIAMTAPFWVVYANSVLGLQAYEWGILLLIAGLIGVILAFPLGSLVDRFGSRRMIVLALCLTPPTIFLYIYSDGFLAVAAILCVITVINGMLVPGFSTLIANIIPRNKRSRLYSLLGERGVRYTYGNFWGGGFLLFPFAAIGSFLGGYVYEMNPTYPWMILAFSAIFSLILAVLYIKEPENAET